MTSKSPAPGQIAVILLAAGAVLGPVAIGGTGEWPRLALEAVMAAAVVLWATTTNRSAWAVAWPVGIAGLTLLQLVPLPDSLLVTIAPVSAGAWKVALQGLPGSWGRISIDPAATAMAGRRLLLALATIAAVADLARDQTHRRWLIGSVAVSGVVIATLALIFPVTKEHHRLLGFYSLDGPMEFWRNPVIRAGESSGWGFLEWATVGTQRYLVDLRIVGDGFGSYVVSNHFAGAVSLTIPCTLAALLFLSRGRLPAAIRYLMTAGLVGGALWLVGPMAKSRAGFGSLLLAGLTLLALSVEKPWAKRIVGLVTAFYAATLLAFVVVFLGHFSGVADLFPETLRSRVAATLSDGRVVAAGVAARMFRASPLLGTGLSTYDDLYPRIIQQPTTMYYAHNDYAQLLAETGLVGLAAAVALAAVLIGRCRRFLRDSVPPERLLDAGPWAALAGIAAHSAFDWNMHVPANAFLACLVAGLAAASGASPTMAAVEPSAAARIPRLAARCILAGACLWAFVLLARDAHSSHVGKQMQMAFVATAKAAREADHSTEPAAILEAAREAGEAALRRDPGNPRLALLVGQTNLQFARQATLQKPPDAATARAYEAAAERCFSMARRRCAACRGLPEPVPPEPRK